ncbi:hypothetical protein ACER0C_009788 [Sarotherodon galilaeus]
MTRPRSIAEERWSAAISPEISKWLQGPSVKDRCGSQEPEGLMTVPISKEEACRCECSFKMEHIGVSAGNSCFFLGCRTSHALATFTEHARKQQTATYTGWDGGVHRGSGRVLGSPTELNASGAENPGSRTSDWIGSSSSQGQEISERVFEHSPRGILSGRMGYNRSTSLDCIETGTFQNCVTL